MEWVLGHGEGLSSAPDANHSEVEEHIDYMYTIGV
jgi:hypothetical protein